MTVLTTIYGDDIVTESMTPTINTSIYNLQASEQLVNIFSLHSDEALDGRRFGLDFQYSAHVRFYSDYNHFNESIIIMGCVWESRGNLKEKSCWSWHFTTPLISSTRSNQVINQFQNNFKTYFYLKKKKRYIDRFSSDIFVNETEIQRQVSHLNDLNIYIASVSFYHTERRH